MDIKIRTLTPLWTGGVDRTCDRLHETGIIGSLRWWFEVLVRGLGGKACDPTEGSVRCPDNRGRHCVVCELFGCTGWARKFRLMVLDDQGNVVQQQIRANQTLVLRFIPIRPVRDEEWCLLVATLRLIADYGAIGGKTVFKPSEEWGIADLGESDLEDRAEDGVTVRRSRRWLPLQQGDIIKNVNGQDVRSVQELRKVCASLAHGAPTTVQILRGNQSQQKELWAGKRHHQDLGLIQYIGGYRCKKSLADLKAYVRHPQWLRDVDDNGFAWSSLKNFWCVKGRYLARQNHNQSLFNRVVGRHTEKNRAQRLSRNTEINQWLAGGQQKSKKVFSFKEPEKARRTFGFIKPGLMNFEEIKRRLKQSWPDLKLDEELIIGEPILAQLFQREEDA